MSAISPVPSVAPELTAQTLRTVYRTADKPTRHLLVDILPPEEIEFAGVRMFVDPRDNFTERMIWLDGQPPEMTSLLALTERVEGRNALILDVGANCGSFTVPLAMASANASRIIAFEPNPVMVERLERNIALNSLQDRVEVECCAIGAAAGEALLNLKDGNHGQASLIRSHGKAHVGQTEVSVLPLLAFTDHAADHDLSVLKIDVEGAEPAVLGPLLETDGWMPDVLLVETRHAQDWDHDLVGMLKNRGFQIDLEADGNTLFSR